MATALNPPESAASSTATPAGWSGHDLLLTAASVLGLLGVLVLVLGGANILEFPPAFLPLVGAMVAAVAVRRRAAWAYLTSGIVLSVLPLMFVVGFFGWTLFLNPLAGPEQVTMVSLSGALVFGLWGGIAGFRHVRAGRHTPAGAFLAGGQGIFALVLIGFLVGTAFTGAMASQQANAILSAGSGITPEATVTYTIHNFEFPASMRIEAGKLTEVTLVNNDPAWHTFTFTNNGKEHSYHVIGGGTTKFLVEFAAAGEVKVRCVPHSSGYDSGMVGKIEVA